MRCGGCGRAVGLRTNPRAGRCATDRIYECHHCSTLRRTCVSCHWSVSDPAGFLLFGAVFRLVIIGPFLGGPVFREAITNAHLDYRRTKGSEALDRKLIDRRRSAG
jgi:hypothetical protein